MLHAFICTYIVNAEYVHATLQHNIYIIYVVEDKLIYISLQPGGWL